MSSTFTIEPGANIFTLGHFFCFFLFLLSGRCPRQVLRLKGQQGSFQSPLYPHAYSPKQTCIWHVRVDSGYTAHLYFAEPFDVQDSANCAQDYVLVSTQTQSFSRPSTVRTGKHAVVFCGTSKPSNISSRGRELWILFQARRGGGKGFKVFYGAQGDYPKLILVSKIRGAVSPIIRSESQMLSSIESAYLLCDICNPCSIQTIESFLLSRSVVQSV